MKIDWNSMIPTNQFFYKVHSRKRLSFRDNESDKVLRTDSCNVTLK